MSFALRVTFTGFIYGLYFNSAPMDGKTKLYYHVAVILMFIIYGYSLNRVPRTSTLRRREIKDTNSPAKLEKPMVPESSGQKLPLLGGRLRWKRLLYHNTRTKTMNGEPNHAPMLKYKIWLKAESQQNLPIGLLLVCRMAASLLPLCVFICAVFLARLWSERWFIEWWFCPRGCPRNSTDKKPCYFKYYLHRFGTGHTKTF